VLGEKALVARWRLGDGALLGIAMNLGDEPMAVSAVSGTLVAESVANTWTSAQGGHLPPTSAVAWLAQSGRTG
jgi:maltooligosyltrehalose trehalohydrolase